MERTRLRQALLDGTAHLRKLRNRLFFRAAGGDERPVFHDVEETWPALLEIDRHFDVIRGEMEAILDDRGRFPRYHEADTSQEAISAKDEKAWRVFFLHITHPKVELSNASLCPRTKEIVERIPGVLAAFFSILEPGKSVPAHEGPSYCYLRYHTALKVPREKPPSIRVKDRHYTWKEGESLLFDDSWEHEVHNEADEVRVVLIVDILRPVPWHLRVLSWIVMRLSVLSVSRAERLSIDEQVKLRQA